ncbi:uncharacterized protein LOC114189114 [Vigna unguiculata]|uniref:Uncharacterized protein n=1 Tax=Vigna unguiculata TaxID=3917 RepID=A0A4D6KP18_VIGUN|nr:uncharacterized protein LOC114189114 [Vigna unguiculata]QCD78420.1 hypothetical protein DEO72_LG1g2053 [Vigna unguiculata]
MSMKLHNWSSSEYKELVLIYSEGSKSNILGLRHNQNRVLLRLRNPFCDSGATRELLVEVTAKKGNTREGFYFWAVKVTTGRLDDTRNHNGFNVCYNKYWSELCGKESCFYEVIRKVGNRNSEEKVNWEFSHWYSAGGGTRIAYSVIIECDKTSGLKAELKGPFKCLNLEKEPESEAALTLQKMEKEPRKEAERKFVESKLEGREHILLAQGSEQRATVVNNIVNSGTFTGSGNGSKYEDCKIDMRSDFKSSP